MLYHPIFKQTLIWPSMETFNGMGVYLKVGLPGVVMFCAEWWVIDILTFISGFLAVEYTAT